MSGELSSGTVDAPENGAGSAGRMKRTDLVVQRVEGSLFFLNIIMKRRGVRDGEGERGKRWRDSEREEMEMPWTIKE